jgi:hypothetical protein
LKSAIKKVNKWFLLTGLSFLPSFWDNHPAAEPPDRYNAFQYLQFELKFSYIVIMKSLSKKKNIDTISREAMKSQIASFHIEGMNIPKKRAEQIRREVVREFQNGSTSSNS